jgi:hypothetical protein
MDAEEGLNHDNRPTNQVRVSTLLNSASCATLCDADFLPSSVSLPFPDATDATGQ